MNSDDQLKRKLAAILHADVVGYSRLTGEDEEGTYRLVRDRLDLISENIQSHNGTVINYAGDAVLADFPTASEALACAAEVQRAIEEKNQALPEDRKVRFRIGVNLGEVIVDRDSIYGDGVNVAARLEGLAEPGGICISQAVHGAVGKKLPLAYEDIGMQKVKNIADPVHAYRVLLDREATPSRFRPFPRRYAAAAAAFVVVLITLAIVAWQGPWNPGEEPATADQTASLDAGKPSIAVLPFQNLGDDASQEYFSDGITNDIITDLSRFSNLFVIASNSVFTYKGKAVSVKDVGRDLGVRYVLEGSVQKVGNSVRINAQLIDATTDRHLWAQRYDRELDDIFAVQDELTASIVAALEITLTEDEKTRVARQYTNNIEAYDLFLRGRTYLRGTKRTHLKARGLFDQAIDLDPEFAAAYAEKSLTYFAGFIMPMTRSPKVLEASVKTAERAVALDDSLPLAHARLGWAYFANQRHEEAIAAGRRAVALGPNDAESHAQLGNILNWSGKPEEAIALIKKAMRLNPHYPFYYLFYLGHSHYLLENREKSIELMKRVVTRAPNFLPVRRHLAVLYQEIGLEEEAKAQTAEVLRIFPGASIEDSRERCLYVQDPVLLGRFFDGLRESGMPEGEPGKEPIEM
jgi:adenylate cyclase